MNEKQAHDTAIEVRDELAGTHRPIMVYKPPLPPEQERILRTALDDGLSAHRFETKGN